MLFNSFLFWVFFAAVATVNYLIPARWSRLWLVLASFVFYGAFNPSLTLLLAFCIVFNYATGLAIGRLRGITARSCLAIAVCGNLGVLGFFKYTGFLIHTATALAHLPENALVLRIVLPVAISFYTFEAISYNVDIYRRVLQARRNIVDFALFISFFPHLVAGPIIRPAHFFPQLVGRPMPSNDAVGWGLLQIVKGLIKKTIFADNFAAIADGYFNSTGVGHGGPVAAWVGVLAFSMQIYFDFAGYTDIARGCARLLGYEFPPNFERPYLAPNIAEFWHRWHISLSTWLRDYLYIPLGGNRRGAARTYINLLVTMGLGGLWHGASWNFAAWGLFHGILLALHRAWNARRGASRILPEALGAACGTVVTFILVSVGWVPFRSPDFATTWLVLRDLFRTSWPQDSPIPAGFETLTILTLLWVTLDRGRWLQTWLRSGTGIVGALKVSSALTVALLSLELFSRTDIAVPFIYFQF